MSNDVSLTRLMRLGQLSSNATAHYHQLVAAKAGLSPQDTRALSVIMFEDQVSAGRLAQELHLTTGAITGLVDRLVRKQLVQRVHGTQDRRKVMLQLNPVGLASLMQRYASMGRAAAALYKSYDADALAIIADFLERSLEITRQEIAALR